MADALLPCPCCAGCATIQTSNNETERILCLVCGLTTPWTAKGNGGVPSASWNTWQRRWTRPPLGESPVHAVSEHEWDPPYHKAIDQPWRCLRCGCRTYRPQDAPSCPGGQSSTLPLLDPPLVEPNPSIPYRPDEAIAALKQQVRILWNHVSAMLAERRA